MPFVVALPIILMELLNLDFLILEFFSNTIKNDFFDFLMPVLTYLGSGGALWIVMTVILLLFKSTRKIGFCMALSLILSLILCNLTLKPIVARPRPFDINKDAILIINKPTDFSFPSGHSSSSFAAASAFLMGNIVKNGNKKIIANKKYVVLIFIIAFLIAISRLYLYVHFPSDVLFGIILGIFCGYTASKIVDKIYNRKTKSEEN